MTAEVSDGGGTVGGIAPPDVSALDHPINELYPGTCGTAVDKDADGTFDSVTVKRMDLSSLLFWFDEFLTLHIRCCRLTAETRCAKIVLMFPKTGEENNALFRPGD